MQPATRAKPLHAAVDQPSHVIGCDVGKTSIMVFDSRDGRTTTIANKPDALAVFAAGLDPAGLVICEATGGYEQALLAALVAAGRPAHRADARKVKAFIRSFGILGKTDAIDARALARYGIERQAGLARWQAPDPQRDRLQALVLARSDFVAQRQACANRRDAPGAEPVAPYLAALLACLETQIQAIEAEIAALIQAQAALARAAAILQGMPGIGRKTAAALLGLMPELGTLDRRQAAALAGLAPHPRQSGERDGYRHVRGGRPEIRRALFMPALALTRHRSELGCHYRRLVANGKKPLVALTALMRKIIVIANARLRDALKPCNEENAAI